MSNAPAFFKLALEIRHTIYSNVISADELHIHQVGPDGVLRLSPCLGAAAEEQAMSMIDRRNEMIPLEQWSPWNDPVQTRRLNSAWGPHWRCEELALRPYHSTDQGLGSAHQEFPHAVFAVCTIMRLEFSRYLADTTRFHLTELSTLQVMIRMAQQEAPASSTTNNIWALLVQHATRLYITLRLPLAFYQTLEAAPAADDTTSHPEFIRDRLVHSSLTSSLSSFRHLRRLDLWLDHSGKEYWSFVNERAVLHPLEELRARNRRLRVHVALPKTHPTKEDPQRHYRDDDDTHLRIRRVLRHRFIAESEPKDEALGTSFEYVQFRPDFPHAYRNGAWWTKSLAEIEVLEEEWWRVGMDVDEILKSCSMQNICYGNGAAYRSYIDNNNLNRSSG